MGTEVFWESLAQSAAGAGVSTVLVGPTALQGPSRDLLSLP